MYLDQFMGSQLPLIKIFSKSGGGGAGWLVFNTPSKIQGGGVTSITPPPVWRPCYLLMQLVWQVDFVLIS